MVALQSYALLLALASIGQVPGVGETVLIDFTADWCGPCQEMKPIVRQLQAVGYPVREVNVDRDRALAAKYRVTSIPCFVMVVDGQEVDREVGATSQSRLVQMISQAQPQRGGTIARAQSPDTPLNVQAPNVELNAVAVPTHPGTPPNLNDYGTGPAQAPPGFAAAPREMSQPAAGLGLEERLIKSAVRLKVEDPQGHSYGTGTIIDAQEGEALVLTCGHIFRDSEGKGNILVDLEGGHSPRQVKGTLISYDLKRDLGLVSIRPDGPVEVARVAAPEQQVQMGDRVVNIGCNNGQNATARRSHVTGIDKYLGPPNIEVAGLPVEGRSGGGLFNEAGQLIGVCFAADPAEDEGVYAGLTSIHAELDRLGLSSLYAAQPQATQQPAPQAVATAQPPAMPRQMPEPQHSAAQDPLGSGRSSSTGRSREAAPQALAQQQLTPTEQAALAEIAERLDDSEVICIIRPKNNPNAKSEIIVLNNASSLFLEQLSKQQQASEPRHLTSLAVPGTLKPAENGR